MHASTPTRKLSIPKALRAAEAHYHARRLPQALSECEAILRAEPNQPDALYIAGMSAHLSGQQPLALELLTKAAAINARNHRYHNALGLITRALGQLGAAVCHYQQAIRLKPDYAVAHNNLAIVFKDTGRLDEAIEHYRQAVKHDPQLAEAHSNLANLLREQGQPQESLPLYRRALGLKPNEAEAHAGLAAALFDLGQHEAAKESVARTLKHNPQHVGAWTLHAQLNKMTANDSAWLTRAQQYLARGLPPRETQTLLYAIGKFHDDTKQYDLAFESYRQANALKRRADGPFDRAGFTKLVDAMIRFYTPEFVNRAREGASPSPLPVWIVGMPRSGTSLTEQIIASHPQAFGAGELNFFGQQARAHRLEILAGQLDPGFIQTLAAEYETCLRHYSGETARIVDKMPNNFQWLGLFHIAFPQAKIIHTRRNPVDTCLSIYFQNFRAAHAYGTDLDDLAFYYREYLRLMAHWRSVLPKDCFLEIHYEDLIENQEDGSRKIIQFLGLPWNERCLDFHKTERKVGTASNWQVRQKIYKTSKERWRNYEQHIGPLKELLAAHEEEPT
jgi:Flp pilus assembly protein TadD